MTDRELLELAAKAASYKIAFWPSRGWSGYTCEFIHGADGGAWNPLTDDGDRYRLIKTLEINIDFNDCCAWKRMPNGNLIQEFWGGESGDEAHAVLRAAVKIGKEKS